MRMFVVAVVTMIVLATAGSLVLNAVQEPADVAFTTKGARPDLAEAPG